MNEMIVSIYIEEHSYLTDKPLTLNFGGEYLYSFKKIDKSLIISRKKMRSIYQIFSIFQVVNVG